MNEELKTDVRLVRHHMRRQLLTQKEVDAHLASLPDDAENGVETDTRYIGYSDRPRGDKE